MQNLEDSYEEINRMIAKSKIYFENEKKSILINSLHVKSNFNQNYTRSIEKYNFGSNCNKSYDIYPGYVWRRCNTEGHHIRFCPTNGNPEFNIRRNLKHNSTNLECNEPIEAIADKFAKSVQNSEFSNFDCKSKLLYPLLFHKHVYTDVMDEFKWTMCTNIFENPMILPWWGISFCWKCILNRVITNKVLKWINCFKETLVLILLLIIC